MMRIAIKEKYKFRKHVEYAHIFSQVNSLLYTPVKPYMTQSMRAICSLPFSDSTSDFSHVNIEPDKTRHSSQ